ncbi:hypothetical protein Naga_103460g1 [Nannochloropsis gaditana]|uniref:Uncharacterized protein n=1 Tax=Nannochloropsis gaditana TaxID=72520 RepID=W7T292_9STRA|nr:hypothetical protein Naga_103460g1 [Nannochloropsis gaditana]
MICREKAISGYGHPSPFLPPFLLSFLPPFLLPSLPPRFQLKDAKALLEHREIVLYPQSVTDGCMVDGKAVLRESRPSDHDYQAAILRWGGGREGRRGGKERPYPSA